VLARGPEDRLHDHLLPGGVRPGVGAVAQGAVDDPALADVACPYDVVVLALAAFGPFLELGRTLRSTLAKL